MDESEVKKRQWMSVEERPFRWFKFLLFQFVNCWSEEKHYWDRWIFKKNFFNLSTFMYSHSPFQPARAPFLYFLRHTNIKIISNIPSITTATISLVSSPRAHFSIVQIDLRHRVNVFLIRARLCKGEPRNKWTKSELTC